MRGAAEQGVDNSTYAAHRTLSFSHWHHWLASPGHQWIRPQAGHYWSTQRAATQSPTQSYIPKTPHGF